MDKKQRTMPEKWIAGVMILIGLAEVAHLFSLFLNQPFHVCTLIMAVLFMLAVLFVSVSKIWKHKKKGSQPPQDAEHRGLKLLQVYPHLFVVILLVIVLQIVWNYWAHLPYLERDITGETVQTILTTDSLYEVNPMTGLPFTIGMPTRLKILVLPTLYASLCSWTGISVPLMCYSIIPSLVLLLSYLVYSRWAVYLFPQEIKKQGAFMLFVVLIYQFGCYSSSMDSFLLFFRGFQGAAFRAGVILPFALLSCLKEDWKNVILCILAEACVVWTFYGLGYTVAMTGILLVLKFLTKKVKGRKKL